MEESTIQILYDSGKLRVLHKYMKDDSELSEGMMAFLQTLYEKYVPAEVRESIGRKKDGDTV